VFLLFVSVVVAVQLRSRPLKPKRGVPSEVIWRPDRNQAHSILYTLYSFLSFSGVVPTYLAQRITRTAIIQRVFVDQIPLLVNAHSAQSFAQKNTIRFVDATGRPIPIAARQAWPTCRLTMKASVIVSIPLY